MSIEGEIKSYRDIVAWQKSMRLAREIYRVSAKWPKEELFGLISQVRRCAVSVPSNIAEGYGRRSPREFFRFLNIAYGSLMELETQVILAGELGFVSDKLRNEVLSIARETGMVLNGLIAVVRSKIEVASA